MMAKFFDNSFMRPIVRSLISTEIHLKIGLINNNRVNNLDDLALKAAFL